MPSLDELLKRGVISYNALERTLNDAARAVGAYRDPERPMAQVLYDAASGAMMAAPAEGGSVRFNPFSPSQELVSSIKSEIENAPLSIHHFGLRVEDGRYFKPGDYLPDSRQWINGEPSNQTVNGVSTHGLPDDPSEQDIERALHKIGPYYGDHLVLVGGRSANAGEDPGESIVNPGVTVQSWGGPAEPAPSPSDR